MEIALLEWLMRLFLIHFFTMLCVIGIFYYVCLPVHDDAGERVRSPIKI